MDANDARIHTNYLNYAVLFMLDIIFESGIYFVIFVSYLTFMILIKSNEAFNSGC